MPDVAIIIIAEHMDYSKALAAVEAGATGYIVKDIPATNLMTALNGVQEGQAFLSP